MLKRPLLYCYRPLLFMACLFLSHYINAANPQHKIDSLLVLLKKDKNDTNKIKHYQGISGNYYHLGNVKMDTLYCDSSLALSQKLNYPSGIADAYMDLGNAYLNIGNIPKALQYQHMALKICKDIGNKAGIASVMGNIGNIYEQTGDYSKALEYFSDALQTNIEIGDKSAQSVDNNNIGIIYAEQGELPKSLDYFFRALKLDQETGDKAGSARATGNIGIIYNNLGEYNKALSFYQDALKLNKELGDKNGIAVNEGNIGTIYTHLNNSQKALEYQRDALKIAEEIGSKYLQMNNLTNIGSSLKDINGKDTIYMSYYFKALNLAYETENKSLQEKVLATIGESYTYLNLYDKALPYLNKALSIGLSIGDMESTGLIYSNLSTAYQKKGDWENAYKMMVKSSTVKDSVSNQEKNRDIGRIEAKADYDKQLALQKADEDKKALLTEAEHKKQKVLILFITAIAITVVIMTITIFRSLKTTRSQKQLIETQKTAVEQQKLLVEEKNKEVTDSINYAKRLQDAILPPLADITKALPESFVLYKPKDIVAGDFYWMEKSADRLFVAAADCTGHGVPGAMVSVVCSNALNRAVKEFGITDTARILDKVQELVLETFEKSGDVKDGMDISLCAINPASRKIQWTGANTPLWYISNGSIMEVAPDRQPIGKYEGQKPFSSHEIQLSKGDTLYLFTDGLINQFGPNDKSIGIKRFKESLLSLGNKDIEEQRQQLEEAFDDSVSMLTQVDDVLIIGVRV